jgi:hypothetical protein
VVLCGCETWSLILREEYRLRVFEKRVLRRISGPKRAEVTEIRENCIMRNFITCTLRRSIIIMIKSVRIRWARHVPGMGKRNAYRILVGRPRRRWEDNIKMDLREIRRGGVN